MKNLKILLVVLLALSLVASLVACSKENVTLSATPVTEVSFSEIESPFEDLVSTEASTVASTENSTSVKETTATQSTVKETTSPTKASTTATTAPTQKATEKQTEKQTQRQTETPTVRPTERQTETQKQTEKQTETQRQTEAPTVKPTEHQHAWEVLERTEIIPAKYETRLVQVGTERVQTGTKTVVDVPGLTYTEKVKVGEESRCLACGSTDHGIDHALECGGAFSVQPIYEEKEVVVPAITHEEPIYEEKPVMKEEKVLVEPEQRKKVTLGYICSGCGATKQ